MRTEEKRKTSDKAKTLIQERRDVRLNGTREKKEIANISKDIQKELRKSMRAHCRERIGQIIADFKGLRHIADMRSNGKRNNIACMRNEAGEKVEDKQGIMNVFADFYEKLYKTRRDEYVKLNVASNLYETVSKVSSAEVEATLSTMAKRKAGDNKGIVTKMLQKGGRCLHEALAGLCNDILDPNGLPPTSWRETRLLVLFKKAIAWTQATIDQSQNYRYCINCSRKSFAIE